jgi:alpha-L-fucosidase 2
MVVMNATMDVAIAREVLGNLCAACRLLEIESNGVERWSAMIDKLPAYEANADGPLKEWLHPDLIDNYHHRHQSHIYPLFPGIEVTSESDPEIFEAARIAVEKRLVVGLTSQTGWSMAHMANIYARLGLGDRALDCMNILARGCVGANLFTYHDDLRGQGTTLFRGQTARPIFQIDANFGLTAAILQMLVFSKPGMIKLLPALPTKWTIGKAGRILCRGGVEVTVDWNLSAGTMGVELISKSDQQITVKFPAAITSFECNLPESAIEMSNYGPEYRVISLVSGEPTVIAVGLSGV